MENPFEIIIQRMDAMQESINRIEQRLSDQPPKSRVGGIELARELTGWTTSTIRKKASSGELPVISAPHAPIRVDEQMLMDFMKGTARKTQDQIKAEVEGKYKTFHRVRKGKGK